MKKLIFALLMLVAINVSAQWVQTDGIYGGEIWSLTTLGSTIFAGTKSNGVYLSTNNGNNWTQTSLNDKWVFSLITHGSNVYAGTYDSGVFRSTNNGINWIKTTLNNKSIFSLGTIGSNILAGTYATGMYISSNNGTSWTQTGLSTFSALTIESIASQGNNIFAGTDAGGVYRSTNNGLNWIHTSLINLYVSSLAVIDSNIYASCAYGSSGGGVYLSTNNGTNWTAVNNGLPFLPDGNDIIASGNKLYLSAASGYTGYGGLYSSLDYGASWDRTNLDSNLGVYSLATLGNNVFVGTSKNGVYLSTNDGTSWTQTRFNGETVLSFALAGNSIFAGTENFGVYRSTNNGVDWVQTALNNIAVYSLIISGNNIIAGTFSGIYLSSDNGLNWALVASGGTVGTVYSLATSGSIVFAGTSTKGIYRSTNNGSNWNAFGLSGKTIRSLVTNGNNIYAGSTGVYYSTNNGSSWAEILSSISIYSLAISGNYIFAGSYNSPTSSGIYRSSNNGTSWTQKILNSGTVNSLTTLGNTIFAGTDKYPINTGSFYVSTNSGNSFYSMSQGNPYDLSGVRAMILLENTILTGTDRCSVWRRQLSDLLVPNAPILIAPLNNSTNQPPTVLLDWDSLTSANTYRVQLATDSLFNTIVYDTSGVAKSSLLMRAGILLPNVKYYWKVNATNIAGTGVWSVIWNFRVNPTGLYQYSTNIPEVFKIHINYPNPFNPSTKIRFDVQRYSMVRIVVYDLTGKEIQTLVNEKIQPGRYEISFYGSQLPSGVYFYKMITEDYIETKKMLLIK